jgi:hypothetical protein
MAEPKTKQSEQAVDAYIDAIADPERQQDCRRLIAIMSKATGEAPKMWGSSIVGFGSYHYRYESGHEGDACLTGFASRKQGLVLYILPGFESHESLLGAMGKYKLGKSCLYVKRLSDVDMGSLTELIMLSVREVRRRWDGASPA